MTENRIAKWIVCLIDATKETIEISATKVEVVSGCLVFYSGDRVINAIAAGYWSGVTFRGWISA